MVDGSVGERYGYDTRKVSSEQVFSMSGLVKVGVVGCGSWSTHAHLPALAAEPRARLVAVVDPDPDARNDASKRFAVPRAFASVAEMLAAVELDAAVVGAPHAAHAAAALPLLKAGVHVLIEKPMVLDPTDGRALLRAAHDHGVELLVGYTWHYNRQVAAVRELILEGRIGQMEFLSCLFGSSVREYYKGNTDAHPELGYVRAPGSTTYSDPAIAGGGQGQAQLTHAAALLLHLTGLRPLMVAATCESFDLPVDLADALIARFDNGSIGTIGSTGGVLAGHPDILEYRLFGSKGHIAFDVMRGVATIHGANGAVEALPELPLADRYPESAPVHNLIAVAADGAENLSPGDLGQVVVELLTAMYRSSEAGGQPVELATIK